MVKRSEMNFLRSSRLGAQARVVGQRSLGCLKRGQPCLHQLHELSTAFSGGLSLFIYPLDHSFTSPFRLYFSTDKSM